MKEDNMNNTQNIPEPVEGRFIYQIDANIRIRFNGDGWVEEIGKGGPDDPLGTKLQGKPASKRDDIYARRYYDLLSRAVIIDIHPKISTDMFRDIDPDAPLYERINKIIAISNHAFGTNMKLLGS